MKTPLTAALIAAAVLAGSSVSASAFTMAFEWGAGSGCSSVAPAFTLARVPANTAKLSFRMVDLNLPSYAHGGGETAYSGKGSFGQGEAFGGAFSSYRGPCPPPTETHRYEWTVQALDAAGKVLGTAKAVKPFKR
jgi:Phosphatidylethanolamine-binding protein